MKKLYRLMGCVMASTIMFTGCNANTSRTEVNEPDTEDPGVYEEPLFAEKEFSDKEVTITPKYSEAPISNDTVFVTDKNIKFAPSGELPDPRNVSKASNASMDMFSKLTDIDDSDNVLISPLSIQMALGMTENGANGDTLSQLEDYINGGLTLSEMNKLMADSYARLTDASEVDWNVANSIWFKNDGDFLLKDQFLKDVRTNYNSEVALAPFDQSTVDDINAWVNNNTRSMIPSILDNIPDNVRSYLINAVAFEGEWLREYKESDILEDRTFTNADGSESKVTMLASSEGRYFKLGEGQGFIKEYKGGEYAFVGILPDEGVTPKEYIDTLADKDLDLAEAVRNAEYKEVIVQIPEFDLDYGYELSEIYKAMGMTVPFDKSTADFTGMMEMKEGGEFNAYISRILHKTHIEVDRKGTKAAAVTAVEMVAECCEMDIEMPEYVILDRPFVYAIVDTETGMPIFTGYQNSME
ncbi:MAG: serpin family protein [Lachnospiraceae bacterium]|nr:serpin family protein [Lachnospiraceae bacterium]